MASRVQKIRRFLRYSGISVVLFIFVVAGIIYAAYQITEKYHQKPDFGGMVTLRQADMDLDFNGNTVRLSRAMIYQAVTDRKILEPIAKRYGWDEPYEQMVKKIEVKERLSSQRSFNILVNTMNADRSVKVARALSLAFVSEYQKKWERQNRENLARSEAKIKMLTQELEELKEARREFQENKELRPVNSQVEMEAINAQLVEAQKQFLNAYGAYITKMEAKRSELQLQYDLARQLYTPNDSRIRIMKVQLAEMDRQCSDLRIKLSQQKPELYKLSLKPKKLTGLPNDILYFYESVQSLQRLKLAMMLDSIIEEKVKKLENERRKKDTVERLIESHSSDVFIREVGL